MTGCGTGSEAPPPEQRKSLRVATAPIEQTTEGQRLSLWETQGQTQLGQFPAKVEVSATGLLTVRLKATADYPPATVLRGYVELRGGTTVPLRRQLGDQALYAQLPGGFSAPMNLTLYTWVVEEPYARSVTTLEFQEPNATVTEDALDQALRAIREKKTVAASALLPIVEQVCEFSNWDAAEDVAVRLKSAAEDQTAPYDAETSKLFLEVASSMRHAAETQQIDPLLEWVEKLRLLVPEGQ